MISAGLVIPPVGVIPTKRTPSPNRLRPSAGAFIGTLTYGQWCRFIKPRAGFTVAKSPHAVFCASDCRGLIPALPSRFEGEVFLWEGHIRHVPKLVSSAKRSCGVHSFSSPALVGPSDQRSAPDCKLIRRRVSAVWGVPDLTSYFTFFSSARPGRVFILQCGEHLTGAGIDHLAGVGIYHAIDTEGEPARLVAHRMFSIVSGIAQ